MTIISIDQIETHDQFDAVRTLVREFTSYAVSLDPEAKQADAFKGLEEQLAALPGIFGPPDGAFLLATVDGAAAGCVAFFKEDGNICEVKRMYVRPDFRGYKLGEKLISELIDQARNQGYRKIVLSTYYKLEAAQHLYAKVGFLVCEPTTEIPEQYKGKVVFMELAL